MFLRNWLKNGIIGLLAVFIVTVIFYNSLTRDEFSILTITGSFIIGSIFGFLPGCFIGHFLDKKERKLNNAILFIVIFIIWFIFLFITVSTTLWICGDCGGSSIQLESAFTQACIGYRHDNCPLGDEALNSSKYAQDIEGKITTLKEMCELKDYNTTSDEKGNNRCRNWCGCLPVQ